MPIQPERVGALAMSFMEQLEQEHGEAADLTAVGIIAAIDNGDGSSTVRSIFAAAPAFEMAARHEVRGLLGEVLVSIDRT